MGKLMALTLEHAGDLDTPLDPRFGRAGAFLIVDEETREIVSTIDNKSAAAAHGAGTGAAATMSDNNVDAVISGRFGPKAYDALSRLGIQMWTAPQGLTARQAIDKMIAGELTQMQIVRY